jgi:hypothetical protein
MLYLWIGCFFGVLTGICFAVVSVLDDTYRNTKCAKWYEYIAPFVLGFILGTLLWPLSALGLLLLIVVVVVALLPTRQLAS